MEEKQRNQIILNEIRLTLIDWIMDKSHNAFINTNRSHICDKVNEIIMPFVNEPLQLLNIAIKKAREEEKKKFDALYKLIKHIQANLRNSNCMCDSCKRRYVNYINKKLIKLKALSQPKVIHHKNCICDTCCNDKLNKNGLHNKKS